VLRKLAKAYPHVSLKEAEKLLQSPVHEERSLALFMLVQPMPREMNPLRGRSDENGSFGLGVVETVVR